MPQKLAMKRLTASDLTFFRWHFENHNAGNQKAINLNADIFINSLYPSLPTIGQGQSGRLPIDLYLYGPGLSKEQNLQRKIVKGESYKNWRLNGEFVVNPAEEPTRYNVLKAGDVAIIEFSGDLIPHTARIVLIASANPDDKVIFSVCDDLLQDSRMIGLSGTQLDELIIRADPSSDHPIRSLSLEADLEDAAQGGIDGSKRLQSRASTRQITIEALQEAKINATRIGYAGEELVNSYLTGLINDGSIDGFEWVSKTNAISPFDFRINEARGTRVVDVKSTQYNFESKLHISYAELLKMRESSEPYDLYRVYQIQDSSAFLRIAVNVADFATETLHVLEALPDGVKSDGVSVDPLLFKFQEPFEIEHLTPEE